MIRYADSVCLFWMCSMRECSTSGAFRGLQNHITHRYPFATFMISRTSALAQRNLQTFAHLVASIQKSILNPSLQFADNNHPKGAKHAPLGCIQTAARPYDEREVPPIAGEGACRLPRHSACPGEACVARHPSQRPSERLQARVVCIVLT